MRLSTLHFDWGTSCFAVSLLVPAVARAQTATGKRQNLPVLEKVADIALPGPAVRFDYQSLDAEAGRLYISHMNADQTVANEPIECAAVKFA